jgi:tRNA wybutosine-synthesizing protein 1
VFLLKCEFFFRFHDLARDYYTKGTTFTSMDYLAPTPDWALFGSQERGFDPNEKRFFRKGKNDG